MNARREIISFWVGLEPSVKGEIKMRKEVQEPNKTYSVIYFPILSQFLIFYWCLIRSFLMFFNNLKIFLSLKSYFLLLWAFEKKLGSLLKRK